VLAKQLLERQHLAVVPGDAFGAPDPALSYATSIERMTKAAPARFSSPRQPRL
jgi:aspartate/methionine/tyrosine aminotransferase